jgi:predicted RNA-binding Zn-ribbon protein involved in translation (DUF1610 family)
MSAMPMTPHANDAQFAHCRNCGFELASVPHAKYCPECGQETDPRPPTFREFVNHFFGNYIAVKGSLVQTLWRLVSRPGTLTVDYLEGRKRRYILPLRLYITVSVVAFLIFGLLASYSASQIETNTKPEELTQGNVLSFGDGAKATFKDGQVECSGLPQMLCDRLKRKFNRKEALRDLVHTVPERMVRYWAYAMFALVPLFAALMKLVHWRRTMTYGEHVVFALHLHAFWILAILLSLAHQWIATIVSFAIPIYAILAMRRVYKGRWFPTILRALAVAVVYIALAVVAVGIVAIIALLV